MTAATSPAHPRSAHRLGIDADMSADLGRLLVRLTVGGMMLLHGVAKIANGPGPIVQMLQAQGLPGALAYGAYIGEVLAPLLLLAGVWTRAAAMVVVVNMLFAVGLVHAGDLLRLGKTGGWAVELQMFYLLGAAAIALLGAGRFSVGGRTGRWN